MKFSIFFPVICFSVLFFSNCKTMNPVTLRQSVTSPSGNNVIDFSLTPAGKPQYSVSHNGKTVINPSEISFDFKDQPSMAENFKLVDVAFHIQDETYEMPWGERRKNRDHFVEMQIELREKAGLTRKLNLYFRAYDDGVAFRYEFPEQNQTDEIIFMDENTEFNLTGDHKVWWIPGDWDIYEHLYNTTKFSEIDALSKQNHPDLAQTYIPYNAVNTPVTMQMKDGPFLSFHEAALYNYGDMTLKIDTQNLKMTSEIVGSDRLGYKARVKLPFQSPWRTIQIADKSVDLINSDLVLNLNKPNQLGQIPWFKPMKYVGIWWEMHIGKSTWDYQATQDMTSNTTGDQPRGKHGATTENTKKYIDFAAENGFGGVLVEGWNTGWEHWIGFEDREGVFDFVTPYPDYDLPYLAQYAQSKGVELIMHHETSAAVNTYDKQMNEAFALMQKHGLHVVKTGYVGKIIPKGEYHHGQWMVNHYQKVIEEASEYEVAVNAHEPIKDTGIRRTWPNFVSREGMRGQEFNAWASDGGNPPEHLPIAAFTRMLSGPFDFTPGAFDLEIPTKPDNQINTTLAQQLALYVVIYSPVQMACDLPENYTGNPAFEFIKAVGVDWEQSIALQGEIGDFVVMAREEKETKNWFVGGINDENRRQVHLKFDFLPDGKTFEAVIYKDGPTAHWKNNPQDISIEKRKITNQDEILIDMAAGGGFAISLMEP